jgi:integrase/recombinase XerD
VALSGGFAERDIASIRLPRWGRVVEAEGVVPWLVVDPDSNPVAPVRRFLRDFVARGNRPGSVRSYAYDLLRWWRWLEAVGVDWDKATSAEVRDFALWLGQASKPRNSPRTASAARAGTVNAVTRKRYLGDQYEPRTVRHGNAVLRSFYEYWIELGGGPLVNPVALDRRGRRPDEHHNPLTAFRPEGKIRYNPRVPRRAPRAMPDERWDELFAGLRSDRDRAILALGISTGARVCPVTQDEDVAVADGEDVRACFGPAGWVLAGPWCACWRGGGQSAVISVTAARALCSSAMDLRPAMAAIRAWVARLLTARGRPRAASWIKVTASSLNSGSDRPASLRWWVMYPPVCSAVMAGMA